MRSERRFAHKVLFCMLLCGIVISMPVAVVADGIRTRVPQASESAPPTEPLREFDLRQRRMSMSAYPVELKTMGRALRIRSEYTQLLPIYTEAGTLYMALRITKGTNWLNGLPRGKYFINNQPVTIN